MLDKTKTNENRCTFPAYARTLRAEDWQDCERQASGNRLAALAKYGRSSDPLERPKCIQTGYGLTVEYLDVCFEQTTSVPYRATAPILEILYRESVQAVNRQYVSHTTCLEEAIAPGLAVALHHDVAGELVFQADVPVRCLRIIGDERYLHQGLADKFDFQKLLGGSINQAYDISSIDTELLLVLSQIQRSVLRGLAAPGYYEAKVIELLALMEQERQACKHAESHHSLPASDLCAVCQAKTILAERLANPPTIAELAELTATSKRKLQSDFKQAFGCTIHEHLQRLRMDKALSLMNDADMALYQVAYAVGYKKAGYFSEIFKKQYGISPEAYRRQYRKR